MAATYPCPDCGHLMTTAVGLAGELQGVRYDVVKACLPCRDMGRAWGLGEGGVLVLVAPVEVP